MGGPAEREVAVVLPREVEAIWICETLGIAIAGAHNRDNGLKLLDGFATKLQIGGGPRSGIFGFGFQTAEVLDRRKDLRKVTCHFCAFIWVAPERLPLPSPLD